MISFKHFSFRDIATAASKAGVESVSNAVRQQPDIVQAIISHANANGSMPTNNFLENNIWRLFRDDISRDAFRAVCNGVRECWTLCLEHELAAVGVDVDSLPDGEVLIRFVDGRGNPVNEQLVTQGAARNLGALLFLTGAVLRTGPAVAREVMEVLNQGE